MAERAQIKATFTVVELRAGGVIAAFNSGDVYRTDTEVVLQSRAGTDLVVRWTDKVHPRLGDKFEMVLTAVGDV